MTRKFKNTFAPNSDNEEFTVSELLAGIQSVEN